MMLHLVACISDPACSKPFLLQTLPATGLGTSVPETQISTHLPLCLSALRKLRGILPNHVLLF